MQGRGKPAAFEIVMNRFMPCIVGKTRFKKRLIQKGIEESKLSTPSDEAFLYLLLENYYDRWVDISKNMDEGLVRTERGLKGWKWESDVPPKYVTGGIKYNDTSQNHQSSKGWSAEGLKQYNVYFRTCRLQRQDPELRPIFKHWIRKVQQSHSETTKSPMDHITIEHDLFDGMSDSDNSQ